MQMLSERNIFIINQVEEHITRVLAKGNYTKKCVIVDENTRKLCLPLVKSVLTDAKIIEIPSGEENKNLTTCQFIWDAMTDHQMDRKSVVINLGGGVIGDMGGFCAATYKRGIDFIQVPTTLLSQVDASVGGKLGVDFHSFKNHIGVFKDPAAVIISSNFLKTLPKREVKSGFAEIIKHCLIADKAKWEMVREKSFDDQDLEDLATHSVLIKAGITDKDPQEKNIRKTLNFGHTIGHAIESFYLNTDRRLLHGEAVAVGMVTEAFVAFKKGFISIDEVEVIKKYIIAVYGHVNIPNQDYDAIIPLMIQDKKNENSVVLAALLEQVGKGNYSIQLTAEETIESLDFYNR